jgi:CheY-like chemotaxis protein
MNSAMHILLLEDDANDAFFFERAMGQCELKHTVFRGENGQVGIDYLTGAGAYGDRTQFPFPDLIVSDIKMPALNGLEFLRWLKNHPEFMVVPVVVFSSSYMDEDIREAYCLGASAFLSKPSDAKVMNELICSMMKFWSKVLRPRLGVHSPCEPVTP